MSMMPGNPCHKDADFPAPIIKTEACKVCEKIFLPKQMIQGKCRICYNEWVEDFLTAPDERVENVEETRKDRIRTRIEEASND